MIEEAFAARLLAWYDCCGRRDLPWKQPPSLYLVWVSEIMLQQTQVSRVIPYYQAFVRRFPDLASLALAGEDEVMQLWSGLGYYSRARNLHGAARLMMDRHQGRFPQNLAEVQALPGIGRSTAGAILSMALGRRHPILDGNVKRVLTRMFAIEGWPGQGDIERRLWELADRLTPQARVADYNQAIMDLGATLCRRSRPDCPRCPLEDLCQAHGQGNPQRYPSPKPASAKPTRGLCLLVILDEGDRLALVKRPPSGIWGGLWSLPECPQGVDIDGWCEEHLGLANLRLEKLGRRFHSFSHFRLDIEPLVGRGRPIANRVAEAGGLQWFEPRQLESKGFPAPIRRILAETGLLNSSEPMGENHESSGAMRQTET